MNKYDNYYPRPLLQRDSFLSLNGPWTLNGKPIEVPFPPESEASGYHGDLKEIHYEKEFRIPKGFYGKEDKVLLHFGAVDQICDVFLNEKHLCHHEGGYLPFSINVTDSLKEDNRLEVKVIDELDPLYPYGKQAKEPSGIWYTQVSGIWQSVWLEAYPNDGIDALEIKTDADTLKLHIDSKADRFTIEFKGYKESFDQHDIEINVPEPHLWSIDDPYLYDLKISTKNDTISSYFALRKTELKKANGHYRFYLNNEPVFINGLLDQGYFKKGIYTPEDPKEYEADVLNMKELGFNTLRKHIKVEPEAFYYYCDKYGMLVIQDMVNSGTYKPLKDTVISTIGLQKIKCPIVEQDRYDFFIQHAKDTIQQLKSHPSIIAYTIYNEGWGQQDASGSYEILKPLDPDRLFDSTSGWFFDDKSDFDSYHVYFRNKVLKEKDKALFLSECGGFKRAMEEIKGSTWGYGTATSEEELMDKIRELHEKMYIPSIKNGLMGAIYTQVSDVETEINGLYTYDRKICKVNKKTLHELNTELQEIYKKECE
ncbi:MAG: glycoside hydrolase family 2 [Erysipelotrichaceae bacterium]|nr:glycoside hydrolase family 2 [Erysipelotrichaceae bacterium]